MPQVRIVGGGDGSVERIDVEEACARVLGERRGERLEDAYARPVCVAPLHEIVCDAGGEVWPCRAATEPLSRRRVTDVAKAWGGREIERLRASLAKGEIPRSSCGNCARFLELGLFDQAALVRDYAGLEPREPGPGPRRLLLRLDARGSGTRDEHVLRRFQSTVDHLDELILEAADPLGDDVTWTILDELAARTDREVAVLLRVAGRPVDAERRERSLPVAPRAVDVLAGAGLEQDLVWARQVLGDGGILTVRMVLGSGNWFDLHRVATVAAAFGARLTARASREDGTMPLAEAPLAEARAAEGFLASQWQSFEDAARPASLDRHQYPMLRREIRRLLEVRASESWFRAPDQVLAGSGAVLALPALDHPTMVDHERSGQVAAWWAPLEKPAGLRDWAREVAADPAAEEWLATRAGARLLLQKAALEFDDEPVLALLRRLYGRAEARTDALREEDELGAARGLGWAVDAWRDQLGLARLTRRRAPFRIEDPPPPASGDPVVTVLIPSYRHEEFITDCIRSALAQRGIAHRVLVCDDLSPDGTVRRARRIRDERLRVEVNDVNLGLGNSVLRALDLVDTPFVALMNSDDVFHPDRLQRCVQVLAEDAEAQLVTTGLHLIDAAGGELTPDNVARLVDGRNVADWVGWYERSQPEDGADLFLELLRHNFLATSTNLVCRTSFLRAEAEALQSLKYCLDWHLFLTAASCGGLRHLPDRLACYRLHPNNTVWFREGRRWSYFLEVNRVAALAVRRCHDRLLEDVGGTAARRRVMEIVCHGLAENTEVAGLAVHANEVLGGLELDGLAASDAGVEGLVHELADRAQRAVRLHYAGARVPDDRLEERVGQLDQLDALRVGRVLAELRQEQAEEWRNDARWARRRIGVLERTLDGVRQVERSLRDEVDQLERSVVSALAGLSPGIQRLSKLAGAATGQDDDGESRLPDRLQSGLARLHEVVAHADETWKDLESRLAEASARRTEIEAELLRSRETAVQEANKRGTAEERERQCAAELAELRGLHEQMVGEFETELGVLRKAHEDVRAELALAVDARNGIEVERSDLQRRLVETESTLATRSDELTDAIARVDDLQQRLETARQRAQDREWNLESRLQEVHTRLTEIRQEKQEILASREWKTGSFLCRNVPLFARGTKVLGRLYRRTRESATRTMMFLQRLFRRKDRTPLRIGAGSTAHFPVISHTFVYQELTCMHTMLGADVKLLHTQKGPPEELHAAFHYLDGNKQFVEPSWDVHTADLEHFRATQPDRYRGLLDALSEHSGIPAADIEQRFEFRLAFTYARRMEAWGADYVHTYFFYDQALNGLVASWMLDIPRGLSTYADHMMQDWPLKCVSLHLKTADVIVATSRRIRDELVGLGGEEIAHKVIVKPNGVDGSRFIEVSREAPVGRPLKLVCVSRIEPKKGMLELAEAAKLLKDEGIAVEMHVIGPIDKLAEGYGAQFEARIAELGVGDVLVCHGSMLQDQMRQHLDAADAFVAPFVETESGDKDGIPTAILEAIATGLPVVATDAGSIPEIIDDGVEGLIVAQKDPEALAGAIKKLVEAPEMVLELGKRARIRFNQEFDIRATEPRLHERIRAAVDARRAAATASAR